MSNINLVCNHCNNEFIISKREHTRQVKKGREHFYCSLSCAGKDKSNIEHLSKVRDSSYNFKGGENKLITEEQLLESSMLEFIRRVKNRKKLEYNIDVSYLVYIWEKQKGICKYTGVSLVLPRDKGYKKISNNYKASIDRIDSSKGYIKDNIQFVSFTINMAKSSMTEEEVLDFIKIIKNYATKATTDQS
jgi:hypothetical protein